MTHVHGRRPVPGDAVDGADHGPAADTGSGGDRRGARVRRGLARRLLPPGAVLGLVAAGVGYVATVDPHEAGHYPTCPFLAISGLYCPGCGGLRMVNSLAHGDMAGGFGSNPLAFLFLPVLAYLWGSWAMAAVRGRSMASVLFRPPVTYAFIGIVVVYGVVRNLPFGHALAP